MIIESLQSLIEGWGISPDWSTTLASAIALVALAIVAVIVDQITSRILVRVLIRVAEKSKANWDDQLVEQKVLHQLAHLVPAMLVYSALPLVLAGWPEWVVSGLQRFALIYLAVVIVIAINRALNAALAIYQQTETSTRVPLKPFIQVIQGIVVFAAVILVVAMIINRPAAAILGGLGAFAAVLLLVFQQTHPGPRRRHPAQRQPA